MVLELIYGKFSFGTFFPGFGFFVKIHLLETSKSDL